MSRMRTDLRPAISISTRQTSNKSLPPVKSQRGTRTPEVAWETDMVQSLQVRSVSSKNTRRFFNSPIKETSVTPREQKTKSPRNASPQHSKIQQEENMKLKNEIEKLKAKIASLQKVIEGQKSDINEKSVTITELKEKLKAQAEDYEKKIQKLRHSITECKDGVNSLERKLKLSTEEINTLKDKFVKEKAEIKKECARQLSDMSLVHQKEMAERDEKLRLLKTRMADALGDNSRERQQQLDELTRELKRVTEEADIIKAKLLATKTNNQGKCKNCFVLERQLQSKIIELKDHEVAVINLQQLCSKMERQLVQQDDLLRQWAKSQGKSIR